jgi:uncharacterized lipoprotein YbaY
MMKRPAGRRAVLIAAGTAAIAAAAGPVVAQSADVRGTVVFAGGAAIPEGLIEIYLEDPAVPDKARRRAAETRIACDGKSKAVAFSLAPPAGLAASPTRRIVARLERADGWLLARGSAQAGDNSPALVALSAVLY